MPKPTFNHGRAAGHGGGLKREGHGSETGRAGGHGRSESSPGHLKRETDSRSARDYAPGHTDRPDWAGREDREGRETVLPEVAPDESAED